MERTLAQAADYDHIWLSPHPDDVVWSAGGQLALQRRAGGRVLVVTICTAASRDGALSQQLPLATGSRGAFAMQVRLAEDAAALGRLDVDFVHGGWLDAPDRCPFEYSSLQRLTNGILAERDSLVHSVLDALGTLRERNPQATIHAPLGVGGHVDHVAVARAAASCAGTWFYEDIPYCLRDTAGNEASRRAPAQVIPHLVDVSEVFAARLAASACYRSCLAAAGS